MKKTGRRILLLFLLALVVRWAIATLAHREEKDENPIVSKEPYPQTEEEIARYGKRDTALVTYADGTEAIVGGITIEVPAPSVWIRLRQHMRRFLFLKNSR